MDLSFKKVKVFKLLDGGQVLNVFEKDVDLQLTYDMQGLILLIKSGSLKLIKI